MVHRFCITKNDHEIIQPTEGGEVEEQQEPELVLIGCELISDTDDSDGGDYIPRYLASEESFDVDNHAIDNYNQVKNRDSRG